MRFSFAPRGILLTRQWALLGIARHRILRPPYRGRRIRPDVANGIHVCVWDQRMLQRKWQGTAVQIRKFIHQAIPDASRQSSGESVRQGGPLCCMGGES